MRETAAQALATLLPSMPARSVVSAQRILIAMIEQDGAPPSLGLDAKREVVLAGSSRDKYVWQVRHAGLLGLKYLVAVRGDLLRGLGDASGAKSEDVKMKSEPDEVKMEVDGETPHDETLLKEVVDAALLG